MADSRKPTSGQTFTVGDRVRVRRGIFHPSYPDLPIGGWVGTVAEVGDRSPPTVLIRWSPATLSKMHPIFRTRSERDFFDVDEMWLGHDELEPDDGAGINIEQPTNIVTKPLSMDDQDDRIRAVLGLTSDDPLSFVDEETLLAFHQHLSGHLTFPIQASWKPEHGPSQQVTIIGLSDPDADNWEEWGCGLLCRAKLKDEVIEISLADCQPKAGSPGRQLVAEYGYWFGNFR